MRAESSPAARTGALVAVALALSRVQRALILAASPRVAAVRHRLVVLGGVFPLGSRATRGGSPP
ncbi:hypothetical protein [Streptomyces resistomycificus]|uniref:Uncharacterized protein n=1 Tax=Streptomyces resistomycificus TaxID=67356 RepID=A0A0L8L5P9_9ACTN|nr:hypothetical protein [Streptomyces resistomycificus]KOG33477.1 hypothetical protein ADK37_22625 [Streptomyces resistomycificus]KUO00961.1 hypothetical protein AQJ84_08280 [Streptomyces resistomycificus]